MIDSLLNPPTTSARKSRRGAPLPAHPGRENGHSVLGNQRYCSASESEAARLDSGRTLPVGDPAPDALLLIEPDAEMRGLLAFALRQKGLNILEAGTGREALDLAGRCRPSTVVLDMDVGDLDGLSLIRQLRQTTQIPILVLAGRTNRVGPVPALEQGACDYMARPIDLEELAARLRVARRSAPAALPEVFQSGSLTVDLTRRTVRVADRMVSLSATEYSILHLFVRHAGMVLTHAQILESVWGAHTLNKVAYVRVYLTALRKKLSNPSEPDLFLTVRAVGYRLVIRPVTGP